MLILKNLMMDKVQKSRLCRLISVRLFCLHMMIWWCRPWFGSTWSSSALHTCI